MTKIVYVTGCLGLIGGAITRKLLDQGHYVLGVDKETYASNLQFLDEFASNSRFKYIKSDINDLERLVDCDYVINTAAETHVDNSIVGSDIFLKSNINGVHHLLNLIQQKSRFNMPTLIHFSTDEVYGDIVQGAHVETDLLKPSNPYSATKAAADMLVQAWARTFNIPYVILRPTHDQGKPQRTWLHVNDTAEAVRVIIDSGVKNEIFNISGNYEHANLAVVSKIFDNFKIKFDYDTHITDLVRPGQDVRYAIDDNKLKTLGWKPEADFDVEIARIVEYYRRTFVW